MLHMNKPLFGRGFGGCKKCHDMLRAHRKVMHSSGGRETLSQMRIRLALFLLATLVLSACDGYIEELRVQSDGSVDLSARAIVVCTDDLQQAIWDGDPCELIDEALATNDMSGLPFGFEPDSNRVGMVGTGEAERRTIDVTWSGTAEEFDSVLAGPGTITQLNDEETEVVFSSLGTPFRTLQESTDPDIVEALSNSRWEPGEFRINAPDLVTEHNGDEIQGRIVIWNLDEDTPDEFRIVFTTADPPLRWWWLVMGGVVLVGLVAMMLILEPSPNKKKPKPKA